MKNKLKVLSLFDGMSVAQQALKNIGADVKTYYASEIDEYAMVVTQSNFPDNLQLGGVETLKTEAFTDNLPVGLLLYNEIDLMIGGSPCQDLSIAKKGREGLSGSRSGLFWEYVRIRDEVKPKYFILENVNSMPKEAKDTISEALGVQPVMINASLVSAQNRKRLFWVGRWNDGKYEQVEIPQPEDRGILLKDILESGDTDRLKSYCVDANYFKGSSYEHYKEKGNRQLVFLGGIRNKDWAKDGKDFSRNFGQGDRVYSPEGKSTTLSAMGGGRGAKTGLYAIKSNYNNTLNYDKANTLGSNSQCQTAKTGQGLVDFEKQIIRKLTPTECLRLQSMPDDYFDKATYKNKPISNTQRYKMCGNAFNCKVIEHILKHLV
jgi:DNA (cytosine-5)-methyltransferase 3A